MAETGMLVWAAISATLKVYCVVAAGFYLAKRGMFDDTAARIVSKIVFTVLLPCLLFLSLCSALSTPDSGTATFLILGLGIVHFAIQFGMGYAIRRFLHPPADFRNGIVAAVTFGNVGDMVIAVVLTIGDYPPFQPGDAMVGVGYISIYTTLASSLMFTIGDYLIRSDYEGAAARKPMVASAELNGHDSDARPLLLQQQHNAVAADGDGAVELAPLEADLHEPAAVAADGSHATNGDAPKYHLQARGSSAAMLLPREDAHAPEANADDDAHSQSSGHDADLENGAVSTAVPSGKSHYKLPAIPWPAWLREPYQRTSAKCAPVTRVLRKLVTPPNIAVLCGLVIGSIPAVRELLLPPSATGSARSQAPLKFLYDTLTMLGNAAVPLGLMNLGASLAKLKMGGPLSRKLVAIVTVTRLLVMPAIGLGIVYLLADIIKVPQLVESPMLQFVLVMETCVPTATFVLILSQLHGSDGRNVATLLLTQYIFLLVTASAFIFATIQIIQV